MPFEPRPKQKEVLKYKKGLMGVSAVPGSGKTRTLSALAAELILSDRIRDDQEVLIVTLVNAAVDNFARQVSEFITERGLLPNFGYRVRTLHGLANDIVRERPALVNLSDNFAIVDEREGNSILQDVALAWVRTHPDLIHTYLPDDLNEGQVNRITNQDWPNEAIMIAGNFIRMAKDEQLTPEDVRRNLDRFPEPLPLAAMCCDIYVDYERALNYRGAVDFQDLIRLALKALKSDDEYLKRLRHRWPFILEDEAQDSSKLQESILALLAGDKGNWVRMGDPNQAIYESFTTANPKYLRDFIARKDVTARELPNSGRSTRSIINLANFLIDWIPDGHPNPEIRREPPLQPPRITATPRGDPQPNPTDNPAGIVMVRDGFQAAQEIEYVIDHVADWLPDNKDKTVAILTPRNDRGAQVVRQLKQRGIEVVELLRSTSSTRETAGALTYVLDALSRPNTAQSLAMAYKVWRRDDRNDPLTNTRLENVAKALQGIERVEEYLWPRADNDWLESEAVTALTTDDEIVRDHLLAFRDLMRRWQDAVVLPIDQLILTIAQDVFATSADLAIAHSIAVSLRRDSEINPFMRLPEFVSELKRIAQNQRAINQIDDDATGFDPERHKGKVTVATMHRAKGLEWDRVYLMSVSNYDFPSAEPQDSFMSEKWFLRDDLNLQAEALAQLKALADPLPFPYEEGIATHAARIEYAAERLRLFYVGITRARRELVITWNTGRRGDQLQAVPFIALQSWWESQKRV